MTTQSKKVMAMAKPPGGYRCFLAGTRLLTPDGEVDVESVRVGDPLVTAGGIVAPAVRVTSSTFLRERDGRWAAEVCPVKVARGALTDGTPHRDLYLSRWHALLLDGVLVPVGDLVNGSSIRIVERGDLDRLDYFHVELPEHGVLIAEGALCESLQHRDGAQPASGSWVPVVTMGGDLGRLQSRLRSAVSPVIDVRNRLDVLRDRLEDRAETLKAA